MFLLSFGRENFVDFTLSFLLFFFFFCLAFSWVGWTVGGPCRKDLVLPMVRRHFSVGRKLGFFPLCI